MTATNPFKKAEAAQQATAPTFPTDPVAGGNYAPQPTAGAVIVGQAPSMPAPPQMPAPPAMPAPVAMPTPGGFPIPGALPTPGGFPTPGGQPSMPGFPSGYDPNASVNTGGLGDDMVIDLTGVKSGGQDYVGLGEHLMYCSGVVDEDSNAGNRMLTFEFTVASGEYAGKRRKLYCALTEKALFKLDETLLALGVINPDSKKPTVGQIKRESLGRLVIGTMIPDKYNGQDTVSFSRVGSPESIGIATGMTYQQMGGR